MEFLGSYILYFTILLLSVLCAYRIERSETEEGERFSRILLFLVLTVPAVLRYNIGTDYPHYALIYRFIDDVDYMEIGFECLCLLLKWLGADSFWLFFVMSVLTYLPFCFGTPRRVMVGCTFMFICAFYFHSYSLVRQALAVSLLLYGSFRLLEGRGLKFLVFVLLASSFHKSALLVLPFYFIRKQAEKPIVVVCLCGVAAVLMLGANIVEAIFSNPVIASSSYGHYADSSFAQETEMGTGLGVLSRMMLPALTLFLVKQLTADEKMDEEDEEGVGDEADGEEEEGKYENTGFISLMCIACIASMYLATRVHLFNRLGDLFRFVPIMCMGLVSAYTQFPFKRVIMPCFVFLYALLLLVDLIVTSKLIGSGLGVMPYRSVFDEWF